MNPLFAFAPFLSVSAAIVLLIGAYIARWSTAFMLGIVGLLIGLAWYAGFLLIPINSNAWGISLDALGAFGSQLLLPVIFIIALMSLPNSHSENRVGSILLVLLSGVGALSVLMSHNWMVLFVAIQCMSIPIYALIARDTTNPEALSAAMRYLLLSAIAMAFMLFGILLLYAETQSFDFYAQATKWSIDGQSMLGLLGTGLILVGIAFKLSIFPFHIWTPEVYQGAPFFVVALMVVLSKSVILIAFLRASLIFFDQAGSIATILSLMAIASLWIGSGLMLIEKGFLRLLAFLSIGHMGFLLVALMAHSQLGVEAILLDLTAFSLSLILILATLNSLHARWTREFSLEEFKGLFNQHPLHALVIIAALFSIIGFPLTAGFIGKYSLFMATIEAHLWNFLPHMAIASLFTLAALARLIFTMFQPVEAPRERVILSSFILAGAMALIIFGIFPEPFIFWIKNQSAHLAILR